MRRLVLSRSGVALRAGQASDLSLGRREDRAGAGSQRAAAQVLALCAFLAGWMRSVLGKQRRQRTVPLFNEPGVMRIGKKLAHERVAFSAQARQRITHGDVCTAA